MQAAFDMTVEWGFDRYTFGRPLASYQAIKHRFADMLTWLEASHAISDAACAAVAAAAPNAFELSSAAKAYVGQYGADLVQDCVQIHGGIGVTFEHDLHLYLRRMTVDRSLFGTPGRAPAPGGACTTSRTWRWRHERAARRGARGVRRHGGPGQFRERARTLDPSQPAPGHARGAALGPGHPERGGGAGPGRPRPRAAAHALRRRAGRHLLPQGVRRPGPDHGPPAGAQRGAREPRVPRCATRSRPSRPAPR